MILAALASGCIDCGERDILVLEFDHRNPEDKKFSLGRAAKTGISPVRLSEELAKCDVRCANCHARRTALQFGSWRLSTGKKKAPTSAEAEAGASS